MEFFLEILLVIVLTSFIIIIFDILFGFLSYENRVNVIITGSFFLLIYTVMSNDFNKDKKRHEISLKEEIAKYEKAVGESNYAENVHSKNLLNLAKQIVKLENEKYQEQKEYSAIHAFFNGREDYSKDKVLYGSKKDEYIDSYEVNVEKKKCLDNGEEGFFLSATYMRDFYKYTTYSGVSFFDLQRKKKDIDPWVSAYLCIKYDSCKDKEPHLSNYCEDPDKYKVKLGN